MEIVSPSGVSAAQLDRLLGTLRFGRITRFLPEIGSTNSEAATWGENGAPEGALVLAERQTRGRGRFDRTWVAEPGKNLTFSLVLRPRFGAELFGMIGLAAAAAVGRSIGARFPRLDPRIKWPNDLLLNSRKLGGILVETRTAGAPHPVLVVGIGLNVNQSAFPEQIAGRATSLFLETGHEADRTELLARILADFEVIYDSIPTDRGANVRAVYLERLVGLHEEVTLHQVHSGDAVTGRMVGVDEHGGLRLQIGDEERTFHAGELTFHRSS